MDTPSRRACRIVTGARRVFLGVVVLLAGIASSRAADVNVLTVTDFKPVLLDLAPSFLAHTGNNLVIASDTPGAATARVMRGEQFDLAVLPADAVDALAAQGKVAVDTVARVAKTGIGVVVKKGAPLPDISTVEAFKQTLLAAPSVAYLDPTFGDTSGVYLTKLFARMGIADSIQRKAVLVPLGLVASRVDDGEAVLGLQQISQLRVVTGVTLVGPLPDAIQNYTVYSAGVPAAATNPAAGRLLLTLLRSESAVPALTTHGLESP